MYKPHGQYVRIRDLVYQPNDFKLFKAERVVVR